MAFPSPSRRAVRHACGVCLVVLSVMSSGCGFYRSLGKGQRMEPARERPHHEVSKAGENIVVAVTTDAEGNIVNINFIKRSRSEAVDGYVAQTITDSFPRQPSTRTVVQLRHSANAGFGEPQVVSREPAPVPAALPAQ